MPEPPKVIPIRPRHNTRPKKSSSARGYDHAHRKARERGLAEHPLCQLCGEAWATDYDHIDGNPFNRDPANRRMLCERCHHGRVHAGR